MKKRALGNLSLFDDVQPEEDISIGPHVAVDAKATDPQTSHAAAAALEENQLHLRQSIALVVELLTAHGSLADFELAPLFLKKKVGRPHLPPQARHWARREGLVRQTSERRRNPVTKRQGIVWALGRDDAFLDMPVERCSECGQIKPAAKEARTSSGPPTPASESTEPAEWEPTTQDGGPLFQEDQ